MTLKYYQGVPSTGTLFNYRNYVGWPMSCCGSSYSTKEPKTYSAGKGIRIFSGKYGEEKVTKRLNKSTEINHVATKNGDLTIITRY